MAITFYYGSGSPFSWRVWLALEHKKIPYDWKLLSFQAGDLRKPEYLALNPRGKVPAIVDDGFALYESNAIVEYLDERFPDGPALFPGDARQRATIRRIILEGDLYLGRAGDKLVRELLFKPPSETRTEVVSAGRDELARELVRLEESIRGEYLAGALSAADFALYPALALVARIGKRRPEHSVDDLVGPKVRAWQARIEALPYFEKTIPPHWKESPAQLG